MALNSYTHGIPVPYLLRNNPLHLCGVELPPGKENELKTEWAEIGGEGFWSLSSAKEGNGFYELRDNNPNTFWQSDGAGPHTITIQFKKLMRISRIDLLLNYKADESYTPSVVEIRIGYCDSATHKVKLAEYPRPPSNHDARSDAWWPIRLDPMEALQLNCAADLPLKDGDDQIELEKMLQECDYLEGLCLQILINENHMGGRDSHVRQIRIYGPALDSVPVQEVLDASTAYERMVEGRSYSGIVL